MNGPSLVLDFPRYMLVAFCTEWLSMNDLAQLDSAVCSHRYRDYFLDQIGSGYAVFNGQIEPSRQVDSNSEIRDNSQTVNRMNPMEHNHYEDDTNNVVEIKTSIAFDFDRNARYLQWLTLRGVSVSHLQLKLNFNEALENTQLATVFHDYFHYKRSFSNAMIMVESMRSATQGSSLLSSSMQLTDDLFDEAIEDHNNSPNKFGNDADKDPASGSSIDADQSMRPTSLRTALKPKKKAEMSSPFDSSRKDSSIILELTQDHDHDHVMNEGDVVVGSEGLKFEIDEIIGEEEKRVSLREPCQRLSRTAGVLVSKTTKKLPRVGAVISASASIAVAVSSSSSSSSSLSSSFSSSSSSKIETNIGSAKNKYASTKRHWNSIHSLCLNHCLNLMDDLFSNSIKVCHGLQHLYLEYNKKLSDDALLTVAASCPRLQSLSLKYSNGISDDGLSHIAEGCSDLRWLNCYGCDKLTDEGISDIALHCSRLQCLTLSFCFNISDAALTILAAHCADLRALNIELCHKVSDEGVSSLLRRDGDANTHKTPSVLESLNLWGCLKISDAVLSVMAEELPDIKALNIGLCKKITDTGLASLATKCVHLEILTLNYLPRLTDGGLASIAQSCINLECLSLGMCNKLSDNSLALLATSCSRLKRLNLEGLSQLTDEGFSIFSATQMCQTLEFLDISGCRKITNTGLEHLASSQCRALKVLKMLDCAHIDRHGINKARQLFAPQFVSFWK